MQQEGARRLAHRNFAKHSKRRYFNLNKYGLCFGPGIRTKKRTRPEKTGPYVFSGCVRFRARNVGAVLRPPKSTSERLKRCSLSSPSWWRRCFCCGSCWCWSWWWLWWWWWWAAAVVRRPSRECRGPSSVVRRPSSVARRPSSVARRPSPVAGVPSAVGRRHKQRQT